MRTGCGVAVLLNAIAKDRYASATFSSSRCGLSASASQMRAEASERNREDSRPVTLPGRSFSTARAPASFKSFLTQFGRIAGSRSTQKICCEETVMNPMVPRDPREKESIAEAARSHGERACDLI